MRLRWDVRDHEVEGKYRIEWWEQQCHFPQCLVHDWHTGAPCPSHVPSMGRRLVPLPTPTFNLLPWGAVEGVQVHLSPHPPCTTGSACLWPSRACCIPFCCLPLPCPPLGGCCCTVRARCGTFLMFLEILPSEEAHCKPLWWVFPNACGWSPEAFG